MTDVVNAVESEVENCNEGGDDVYVALVGRQRHKRKRLCVGVWLGCLSRLSWCWR